MQHKPSQKRTLDEVLRSLQDLIRNELLAEPDASSRPDTKHRREAAAAADTDAAEPHNALLGPPGRETAQTQDRDPAAASLPDLEPLDLPQVIESLHDLVTNELDAADTAPPDRPRANQTPAPPPTAAAPAGEAGGRHDAAAAIEAIPPEGRQEELPLFASPPPAGGFHETAIEVETEPTAALAELAAPEPEAVTVPLDADPSQTPLDRPVPETPTAPRPSGEDTAPVPPADDIPVLKDIALPPPPSPPGETPRADPEQAHSLAVQVVARLNIELRRAGEPPLDPRIIRRLEHLLQEALLQAASPVSAPRAHTRTQRKVKSEP